MLNSDWQCGECGSDNTTQVGSSSLWYCVECGDEFRARYISSLGRGAVLFCPVEHQAHVMSQRLLEEAHAIGLQQEETIAHFPCTSNS